jgi:hypothetical protein
LFPKEEELVKDAVEEGIVFVTPAHPVLKAAYVAAMQQQVRHQHLLFELSTLDGIRACYH